LIRASALLVSRLTDELVGELGPVRPESVSVRFFPRWIGRLGPGWVAAMAMPWAIYLRPELLAADDLVIARTIAHELVHMRQWKTLGPVRFLYQYVSAYVRNRLNGADHRQAYATIPLEKEAYAVADRCFPHI
jgi:hypothetical protein